MRIRTFIIKGMDTNSYLIADEKTGEAIITDPGGEIPELKEFVQKEGIKLKAIVLTHAHFDHIAGIKQLLGDFSLPIICGENEQKVLEDPSFNLSPLFGADPISMKADKLLGENEEFSFGELKFRTIFTPGHTPGGICLYFENENVLISGDTLFAGSIGRTDFPGGSYRALTDSIREKLLSLPDETAVFPGHGPKTTIENEKLFNPYCQ